MVMPRDSFKADVQDNIMEGWRLFINNMEKSLELLEQNIDEAAQMSETCTSEWCEATEHVIDEIANSLFSISEPNWSSGEDSKKIKELKRRVHDLYAKYKHAAEN
jgi:Mg2+ and Co2+ transporter CorA